MTKEQNRKRLLTIVDKHPGNDCLALELRGWKPNVHGSLVDAMLDGDLEFFKGGWYLTEQGKRKHAED